MFNNVCIGMSTKEMTICLCMYENVAVLCVMIVSLKTLCEQMYNTKFKFVKKEPFSPF